MADVRYLAPLRVKPKLVSFFWDAKAKRPGWKAAVVAGSILTHYDLPYDIPQSNRTEAERKAKALVRKLRKAQQS